MTTEQRAPSPRVTAIAHAHIDPVWIWDWREGAREALATFGAAVDRLEEYGDLVFSASSAVLYAWVEALDPALFARVRALVESGRWRLVGGQWIEPDCNLPSGEAVCRQLLYGQRYFADHLGRRATVAYNIDSFGHAASLPQLYRKAGLLAHVMMRPQAHEKDLPDPVFAWRGVDGTLLPTFRIPFAYNTSPYPRGLDEPNAEADLVRDRARQLLAGSARSMVFVGVSDHGGGPTRAAIAAVHEMEKETHGAIAFGSVESYFAPLEAGLPIVDGDLHEHAIGCYSALSAIKRGSARAEAALVTAEKMAALAAWATGRPPDADLQLTGAWKDLLFNQFHDTLGGTCPEEVMETVAPFLGRALATADEVETRAAQQLALAVDTSLAGAEGAERLHSLDPFPTHLPMPVILCNPLSWPIRAPQVLPFAAARVTDSEGRELPLQPVPSREATRFQTHALVLAELPAFGSTVLWLQDGGGRSELPAATPGIQVEVDAAGGVIEGLRDPAHRNWLLSEGLRPVVLDDPSDTWSHGVVRYDASEEECEALGAAVVESGPVRWRWRLRYRYRCSTIRMEVVSYVDLPYVDLEVHADWHEGRRLIKLVVPLAMGEGEPRVLAGVPYGAVERAELGEEVMNGWLDVSTATGAGVTCAAASTYGYDLAGGRLRLTVLRSPRYADHQRPWAGDDPIDDPLTDQGVQVAAYRLSVHGAGDTAGQAQRMAEVQRTRFPRVAETWHEGRLPRRFSALTVEPANVVVAAAKRAEREDGWVLRLREISGQEAAASLIIPPLDRRWSGHLGPQEVTTLFFPDDAKGEPREIDLVEDPISGD